MSPGPLLRSALPRERAIRSPHDVIGVVAVESLNCHNGCATSAGKWSMRIPITLIVVMGLAVLGHARARPDVALDDTPASSPQLPDRAPKSEKIACTLTVEPITQLYRIPAITVVLTNQTGGDVYLVGSLDGSDARMRYPHCYFEVIGPDGKPADGEHSRCGNMNYLREGDFVRVPPGAKFDPYHGAAGYPAFTTQQILPYTFRAPGKYRIRFLYSTASAIIADWAGDRWHGVAEDQRLTELLRLVPKVEVTSNEVVVEVEAVAPRGRQ